METVATFFLWNRLDLPLTKDMADEFHTVKDDHDLKILQAVAKHYHLPLLNYEKAMVQFGVFSNLFQMA